MRMPVQAFRDAVAKKRKAATKDRGPSKRPRSRSPPRIPAPAPLASRPPPTPEPTAPVDLDTPPEEQGAEEAQPPQEPSLARARLTWPADDPVPEEAASAEGVVERPDSPRQAAPEAAPAAAEVPVPAAPFRGDEGSQTEVVSARPSRLSDGRRAELIMAQTRRPDLTHELFQLSGSVFFRELATAQLRVSGFFPSFQPFVIGLVLMTALMQMSTSVFVIRDVLSRSERALRQSRNETAEAQARALRAEGDRDAARTAQTMELAEARRELAEVRREAEAERERGREVQERLDAANAALNACDRRIEAYALEVKASSSRVSRAEEAVRQAEEATRAAKAQVIDSEAARRDAEDACREAEAARREAEARRDNALADFRQSSAYVAELAEASTQAYVAGFDDAKKKVERAFGLTGLDGIEPDDENLEEQGARAGVSEPAEDEPIPAGAETAPTEDRPAVPEIDLASEEPASVEF